jgi:hypothetical protein
MDRQTKPNSGVFFSQSLKKSDNAPDYTGEVLIDIRTFKVENNMISVPSGGLEECCEVGQDLYFFEMRYTTHTNRARRRR